MLDMSMFREKSEILRKDHDKRKIPYDNIDEVIRLDNEWKQARFDVDQLRKSRNEAARTIAAAKKAGDTDAVNKIMSEVSRSQILVMRFFFFDLKGFVAMYFRPSNRIKCPTRREIGQKVHPCKYRWKKRRTGPLVLYSSSLKVKGHE